MTLQGGLGLKSGTTRLQRKVGVVRCPCQTKSAAEAEEQFRFALAIAPRSQEVAAIPVVGPRSVPWRGRRPLRYRPGKRGDAIGPMTPGRQPEAVQGGARSTGGTAGMRVSAGSTGQYKAPPRTPKQNAVAGIRRGLAGFGKDFPAKAVFQIDTTRGKAASFSAMSLAVGDWLFGFASVGGLRKIITDCRRKTRISSTKLKQAFGAC